MASIESVRASIDANIKTNGRQEITGVVMNAVLNNMVDLSEKNEGTLEEQKTLLNEQSRQIDSLEQKKANEDGKYPELTAGFANNLVGRGEAVDATINFRPSGGTSIEDGAARVKELKGNSVVWNQMLDLGGAFLNEGLTDLVTNTKLTSTKSTIEWKVNAAAASRLWIYFPAKGTIYANHKYILICEGSYNLPRELMLYNGVSTVTIGASGQNSLKSGIIQFGNDGGQFSLFTPSDPIGINTTHYLKGSLHIVDLTQMFGAGNEPTSVEEFYNRIPQNVDLYAYNEGEVISTNAEGIKSVGFNAWDEQWEVGGIGSGENFPTSDNIRSKNFCRCIGGASYYCRQPSNKVFIFWYDGEKKYISYSEGYSVVAPTNAEYFKITDRGGATYNGGICINLSHSGYRDGEYQPYVQFIRDIDPRIREAFPNGMRSAGNASDKVYNKNGKGYIEKHIGVLDLGTIDWVHQAIEGTYVFRSNGQSKSYGIKDSLNGLCARYLHTSQTASIINSDGYIDVYSTWLFDEGNIIINDSRYSIPNEFKNSLNGVYLFYELAEPEILEFDEPFNLDYEVWDFGTEQMIATEPSAPIKASIVYGFNAVDSVRTAQLEIAELKTQIAQMQAIMASMTAQPAMIKE